MQKPTVKYLLCPGYIKGKHSGNIFYVSVESLMQFYGVDKKECVIAPAPWAYKEAHDEVAGLIKLMPQQFGDYKLPEAPLEIE